MNWIWDWASYAKPVEQQQPLPKNEETKNLHKKNHGHFRQSLEHDSG